MDLRKRNKKPAEPIEVSDKHRWPRLVLIGILIVIAAVALTTALMSFLTGDPGWRTIQVDTGNLSCGDEFVFKYYFAKDDGATRKAQNQLTALYSQSAQKAYWLFNADGTENDVRNIYYLNTHVNEVVTVDGVLYDALAQMEAQGGRYLYLGPVYSEYDSLFFSESDAEAAARDPVRNAEAAEYIQQVLSFANDPEMIRLELLGDNRVRLKVAQAYLDFAGEYEIQDFLDFHWMKNAFIADFLADELINAGFTDGYLASIDGFTRNLHQAEESYSFNIFDLQENQVFLAARMAYSKPTSIVYLRSYPINPTDSWHYYAYADGRIATSYVDPADGLCKSAVNSLVGYASDAGCAEILMQLLDVYITDEFQTQSLLALADQGVHTVWCQDACIYYTDAGLTLYDLYQDGELKFTKQVIQ